MSKIDELINEIDVFDTYNEDTMDDEFLAELPISLLESSIESQFADPLDYRKKDYIQDFITKYNFAKDNNDLGEDYAEVDDMHDNFISFIIRIFDEYLDVAFVEIDDMNPESQHDIIHNTYRFFIKNIKKNFTNIVMSEINKNRNTFGERFEKREDVTYLTFKSEIDDINAVNILANLSTITEEIFDRIRNDYTIDDFFKACEGDEVSSVLDYVRNAYKDFKLTGNFIDKYCDMIDSFFKEDLEAKVRGNILKEFPNRIRPVVEEVVENISSN